MGKRVIFHIDVNSAFLSWTAVYRCKVLGEKEDLRQIPSAIVGDKEQRHGVILAKSLPAKAYGVKTNAVITPNTSSLFHRYTTSCYLYEYQVDGKTYEGNSLVEERDSSKIGATIQILYLDWLPWFNRPVYYWDY